MVGRHYPVIDWISGVNFVNFSHRVEQRTPARARIGHGFELAEDGFLLHRLPALQRGLQQRLDSLTERERDVMNLVVAGLPNKLVADQLQSSVRTVEVHRSRVFDKMGVKSAVELANLLRGA